MRFVWIVVFVWCGAGRKHGHVAHQLAAAVPPSDLEARPVHDHCPDREHAASAVDVQHGKVKNDACLANLSIST